MLDAAEMEQTSLRLMSLQQVCRSKCHAAMESTEAEAIDD
jgi:hypothetical protein